MTFCKGKTLNLLFSNLILPQVAEMGTENDVKARTLET